MLDAEPDKISYENDRQCIKLATITTYSGQRTHMAIARFKGQRSTQGGRPGSRSEAFRAYGSGGGDGDDGLVTWGSMPREYPEFSLNITAAIPIPLAFFCHKKKAFVKQYRSTASRYSFSAHPYTSLVLGTLAGSPRAPRARAPRLIVSKDDCPTLFSRVIKKKKTLFSRDNSFHRP